MLERYPIFGKICNTMDPVTMLYPLQKAIRQELIWTNGVKIILDSAPEILSFPDPRFGLLPFQLAAESDEGTVDLTYHLLKMHPQVKVLLFYFIFRCWSSHDNFQN